MGIAAKYFVSADAEIQTLHRRITPTDDQFEEQQERWNTLADFLRPYLAKRSGCAIRTWLQGSYKFGTQIRPVKKSEEFDIDLGVYFCWDGSPENGDFGPKQLKDMVQESLHEFREQNEGVESVEEPARKRCARVHFSGDFHIDVPSYHLDESKDNRSLTTEDDEWEGSDPKALYEWFKNEFTEDERRKARRQVRYVKAWAALKFKSAEIGRPSSVLLTVLVAEALRELDSFHSDDEDLLVLLLRNISARVKYAQEVLNPVDTEENLAKRLTEPQWGAFAAHIQKFSEVGDEAYGGVDELKTCSVWSLAFEHLFPLPEESILAESNLTKALAANVPPEINVFAQSRSNKHLTYQGRNSIGPIPRGCDLRFDVANPQYFPAGTKFYWMVRNGGVEAENTNDLGHAAGEGLSVEESSAYAGSHFMDCTALRAGTIIGITRVKVTIGSIAAPRRTPRKAAWVGLRGRR